eukprot:3893092-Prymnesium_polylepis.1
MARGHRSLPRASPASSRRARAPLAASRRREGSASTPRAKLVRAWRPRCPRAGRHRTGGHRAPARPVTNPTAGVSRRRYAYGIACVRLIQHKWAGVRPLCGETPRCAWERSRAASKRAGAADSSPRGFASAPARPPAPAHATCQAPLPPRPRPRPRPRPLGSSPPPRAGRIGASRSRRALGTRLLLPLHHVCLRVLPPMRVRPPSPASPAAIPNEAMSRVGCRVQQRGSRSSCGAASAWEVGRAASTRGKPRR